MSGRNVRSDDANAYYVQACEHCEGIIRHEIWCQTLNPAVCYARKIVVSPTELTIGDAIILHSLGVLWDRGHTGIQRPSAQGTGKPRGRSISSLQSVLANIGSTLENNQNE